MAVQRRPAAMPRVFGLALLASAMALGGCYRDACNNECTSGTICDQSTASCVSPDGGPQTCQKDTDCTSSLKHCNEGGHCVECINDSQCPAGVTCNASTDSCEMGCTGSADCATVQGKPECSATGVCVECTSSLNCADLNGKHRTCDPGTNACVLNPCQMDTDCASDPSGYRSCLNGACVQCVADATCAGTAEPHCSQTTNTCVECVMDTDCNEVGGFFCVMNSCQMTGCTSDSACQGDEHCSPTTHACVACVTSSDCDFGGICSDGQCVEPSSCTGDPQCLLGTVCSTGGQCVACRSASDCATGQTCRSDGTCQPPAVCSDSSMCGPGQACSAGSCVTASCVATMFGANNSAAAAATLPSPGLTTINSELCPNEPNYFVLATGAGDGVQATLTPAVPNTNLTLTLVPGPGPVSAAVQGVANRSGAIVATVPAAADGTRAVMVIVSGDVDQSAAYTLTTNVSASPLCQPDPRQPDATQTQAVSVTPGSLSGTLCPMDQQWFALDVPANQRPVATLTSDGGAADLSVVIYTTQNGSEVLDSYSETNSSGAASDTATTSAGTGGQTYWVSVVDNVEAGHTFNLTISLLANPPANDQCTQASSLPQNATVMGTTAGAMTNESASCGGTGGDVFWSLVLTQASQVQINLVAAFDGVLSLERACGDTGELGCAGATSMAQQLSFQALPVGRYLVRVAGADPSNLGQYTLSTMVQAAPTPTIATCAAPDALTFSGMIASASGNVALASDGLTSPCGQTGGDAVYAFTLLQAQKVDVALTAFPGAAVSIAPAASCSSPAGDQCAAADHTGNAALSVNAAPAGDYVLIVDGGNAISGQYSFTVTLSDPIYPPPNQTCGTAIDLASGTSMVMGDTRASTDNFTPACAASGAQSGDVVYHINVAAPAQVVLQLAADFDAAMELTSSPCGTSPSVGCALGQTARLREVLEPGDYYLWIDGYNTDSGTFTLNSDIEPAGAPPPNQTCGTASAIDLSSGSAMLTGSTTTASETNSINPNHCLASGGTVPLALAGPNVVYSVTIPAGQMLTATLSPVGYDGALYVVNTCSDMTCLAGADNFEVGGTDTVSVANSSGAAESVFVVVGSWSSSAWGTFTLALQLQ